jgi:hypothetical protein
MMTHSSDMSAQQGQKGSFDISTIAALVKHAGNLYEEMIDKDSPVVNRLKSLCRNEQSMGYPLSDLVKATKMGKPILGVSVKRRKTNGLQVLDISIEKQGRHC